MKRLLIVGCGDVAFRTIPLLTPHYRVYALLRNPVHAQRLRSLGVTPVIGDLDRRASLAGIGSIANVVLHLAPPPNAGLLDTRTRNLLAALSHTIPGQFIYISTSGVYGDCAGGWVSETHPLNAKNPRAVRRVDAERQVRAWAMRNRVRAAILRVPGIYAHDRLPLDRLRAGSPAIAAHEDSYSNHIHADDLARIIVAALRHAQPNRVYHTSDDEQMKMGDYFDAVADACRLPRPPRLPRAAVQTLVSPMMWSFMNESRCMTNHRMKHELGVCLRYARLSDALSEVAECI